MTARKSSGNASRISTEKPKERSGISDRIGIAIVIEVSPYPDCPACFDPLSPIGQLSEGVVVPIPLFHAMKSDVDVVRGPDQFVRQSRPAA